MSKISLIAKLTAAEGKTEELATALGALISAADEEDGLEIYAAHRDAANDDVFWFYELYAGQDALDVHGKGDGMKAAMAALGALLGARPEITMLRPLVAKGIDV